MHNEIKSVFLENKKQYWLVCLWLLYKTMEIILLFIILIFYTLLRIVVAVFYDEEKRERHKIKAGLQLLYHRKYEEALAYFDHFIKKNPRLGIAYAFRGKCHLQLENYYAAITDCTKATTFAREIPDAFLDKGIALFKLCLYKEALLELDKAVWHLKNNATAFRWRGMAKTMLNQYDKAETDFHKAVELGDEHANYYLLRKGKLEI